MNLLNKLTIKNLKLNKKRTIVTIIGIILSVALITAVASIYTSGIDSLINYEIYQKGNFHVAYYNVPLEELDSFNKNREIVNINITGDLGYAKINSQNKYKPYAFLKAFTKESMDNLSIRLVEGRLPQNDHEILIPTHLKTNGRLELALNSEITLDIGTRISLDDDLILGQTNPFQPNEKIINTKERTYKIVGIIERPASNIESYSAPGYTFITLAHETELSGTVDVYARYTDTGVKNAYQLTANILGVDEELFEKYETGTASYDELNKYIKEESEHEKYLFDINSYLITLETDPLGLKSSGGLVVVVGIVIGIIIITSIFCIKTSFDISITEKIKQYGMLRSIGATKKQIKKNVFYEATILGLLGIPLGILSGLLASFILLKISNYFLRDNLAIGLNLQFSFSILAIIIAIVLGIITIYFSAFRSARRASKISPIDSIRNSANIKISAKKIKSPKWVKKVFGMGGEISYKNLKRNKKKYRTTVISLVVSVFVFIALSSFMEMAFATVESEFRLLEYNLFLSPSNINSKESFDKFYKTTELDNIDNYTALRSIGFSYQHHHFNTEYVDFVDLNLHDEDYTQYINIYALGEEQYKKYIEELGLDYDEISDKGILMDYRKVGRQKDKKIIYKNLRLTDFKAGDTLSGTLNNQSEFHITLGNITNIKPFGLKNSIDIFIIVSDKLFDTIVAHEQNNSIQFYFKSDNVNKLQDEIDELLKGESYTLTNEEESVQVMNNLFTLIGIFLYGFIIVISLIGITNIFNTITTNMELRKSEFAMLKSVGMTTKEFNRMIRLETFFMGMKALLLGIPIGTMLSYLIYYSLAKDSGIDYKLPILAIVIAISVVFILISLIMKYSMSKINRQNTIETIRNENI